MMRNCYKDVPNCKNIRTSNQLLVLSSSILLILLFIASNLYADVERVIDYQYDSAGNIIRTITQEQSSPPIVLPIDPNFINIGRTISITATGSNLLGVDVTTSTTGLSISDVTSTINEVTFRLTASASTPVGSAFLDFTTGLGVVQQTIFVAEAAPSLTTVPSPIAITQSGPATDVILNFSEPRPENETYTVSISNSGVATSVSSFTILSGESQSVLTLTGVADGTTNLDISLASKFYFYSFPVFVGKSYAEMLIEFPDMGQRNLFTDPVGVRVNPAGSFPVDTIYTDSVGVQVNLAGSLPVDAIYTDFIGVHVSPADSFPVDTIFTDSVGVFVEGVGINNSFLSDAVGVNVSDNFIYSGMVGSTVGPVIDSAQPAVALAGSATVFSFTGFNLNEVQTISTVPGTDIIIGTINVNPEGTLLTVELTINSSAALGQREIVLEDASGPVANRTGSIISFDIQ